MYALEQANRFVGRANVIIKNILRKKPRAEILIKCWKVIYLGFFLLACFVSWEVY